MRIEIDSKNQDDLDVKLVIELNNFSGYNCKILTVGEIYLSVEDAEKIGMALVASAKQYREISRHNKHLYPGSFSFAPFDVKL